MAAEGKSCGECSMCCKLLAIEEIAKPAGQWCPDVVKGRGCGIYETRPRACRAFMCEWIDSKELGPEWRPDRSRLVLSYDEKRGKLAVVVDRSSPLAWRKEPFYSKIKALSERSHDGFQVLVCIGDRRIVIFPHEDVDLGVINPDHKIVSGWALRGGVRTPYAMVLSDPTPDATL